MNSGIYQIRNLINDKIYIGSAVDIQSRWYCHTSQLNNNLHHNTHLQKSWNKYGSQSFVFEILESVHDKNDLITREQFYFDKLTPFDIAIGYNICKIAGSSLGRIVTDEHRKNISLGRKGKLCGKDNPNYGKRGTDSIWYNKKHCMATKNKMSKSADARKNKVDKYTLDGIFLKTYESLTDAAKELNRDSKLCSMRSGIMRSVNSEYKTAYGFIWKLSE